MFFGLGSDGTVGANKASVKIIGESTDLFAQGYFVYDSKKSGSVTVSHLRFGPGADPLDLPRRGRRLRRLPPVRAARARRRCSSPPSTGRRSCSTPRTGPTRSGITCPASVQQQLIDKEIDFWVIDALAVADEAGMGSRINTVMQPCFFQLAGILPADEAIARIKGFVEKTYAKRGEAIVARNFAAIDRSLERARPRRRSARSPTTRADDRRRRRTTCPDFVARITSRLIAGDGDLLPVSALPVDGTFPTGTTKYEKRAIAQMIPIWDPVDLHRLRQVRDGLPARDDPDEGVPDRRGRGGAGRLPAQGVPVARPVDHRLTIQVAPDDCTGCGVCVDVCPAKSKTDSSHKAINMEPVADHRDVERARWDFFQSIPPLDREPAPARLGQGLAGARAAVRVLGRLRRLRRDALHPPRQPALRRPDDRRQRDRLLVDLRRQPADDAVDGQRRRSRPGLEQLAVRGQRRVRPRDAARPRRPDATTRAGCSSASRRSSATDLVARAPRRRRRTRRPRSSLQRERVDQLRDALAAARRRPRRPTPDTCSPSPATSSARASGSSAATAGPTTSASAALDQVLSSGRNVNILVLDTEVYSNTGGQASKATPRGAVAKFAAAGKGTAKKDLGAIARVVRQRLRRPGRDGRERPPDDEGAPRGGCLAGSVARHRLQHLHRPRHRHEQVDDATRRTRSRAATGRCTASTRPRSRAASRSSSTPPAPSIPIADFVADRDALRRPPADAPGTGGGAGGARPGRRRRALALLRTARGHRTHRSPRPSTRPGDRCPTSRATRATATRAKGTRHDGRPAHPLPRSRAPLADRRLGRAAQRGAGDGRAARGSGRRGDRPAVAVRGGDRARGARAQPRRSSRAPSTSPRRSTTSRRSISSSARPTDTLPLSNGSRPGVAVPIIASLNATQRRRLGPATRGSSRTPAPTRSS